MRKILSISGPLIMIFFLSCSTKNRGVIMTVKGPIPADKMGITLPHEHILVDFIGADSISMDRWERPKVIRRAVPILNQVKALGCMTFIECTPAFIGRDPELLRAIADSTGLNIITNTGYYGAGENNKFIPAFAFTETADELAARWTSEWTNGIGDTGIKPGFIKIGVTSGHLSDLHARLVTAAARTHLKTGLIIASHTGPAVPAFEELDILKREGVSAEAFIWVHAQAEKDLSYHVKAARMGAWVELDGVNNENVQEYVDMIRNLKDNNLLSKVLLSHDSGWYNPGEENGGNFHGYTALFEKLVPLLLKNGFTDGDIHQLLVTNPSNAFSIRIRGTK